MQEYIKKLTDDVGWQFTLSIFAGDTPEHLYEQIQISLATDQAIIGCLGKKNTDDIVAKLLEYIPKDSECLRPVEAAFGKLGARLDKSPC